MNAELDQNILLPGDKVVFIPSKRSNAQDARFTTRPWWKPWSEESGTESKPIVHSIRQISIHPMTGEQIIHLVGCYGVSPDSPQEPGFVASDFKKLSEARGITPVKADDIIQVPVEVTPRIVRQLESFALFPQVEAQHEWDDDAGLDKICRRWVNRWHQSKCVRDASATVRDEIAEDRAVTLVVPMSELGVQNLAAVCKRLEITQEAWLQGVLHNLAHRCQKMRAAHECSLRNAHKRNR